MLFIGIRYGIANLVIPFFLFKLAGQILFTYIKKQEVFLFFPNFLEAIFLWTIIFPLLGWSGKHFVLILDKTLLMLLIFEVTKEFFLHIYWPRYLKKNGFPNFLRVFGVGKEVNWG